MGWGTNCGGHQVHDTIAWPCPAVAPIICGAGDAPQLVRVNDSRATTAAATAMRSGLIDRAIVSPPSARPSYVGTPLQRQQDRPAPHALPPDYRRVPIDAPMGCQASVDVG